MKHISFLITGALSLSVFCIPVFAASTSCTVNGALPDAACTPGVALSVTEAQVCTSGYAKSVRNVSTKTKSQVYAEYGISSHSAGQYEVDHLISLELGGSNDIKNLWPEAALPTPGFHEKDKIENDLHKEVCNGSMTLEEAQKEISTNWQAVTMTTTVSKKSVTASSSSSKSSAMSKQAFVTSKASSSTSSVQCLIKGNISKKGEKIYHLPGCPSYNQTKMEAGTGKRWFCTEAEAQAAGWRKAGNCK